MMRNAAGKGKQKIAGVVRAELPSCVWRGGAVCSRPMPDRTPTTSETLLREVSAHPDSPRAEEFARLYEPVLKRYVARARANHGRIQPADRDDIVQEAFLAVRSALPRFHYDRARGRFRAYLRRVVRNAVMLLQKRQAASVVPDDVLERPAPDSDSGCELSLQVWTLAFARVVRSGRFAPNTIAAFKRLALEETPAADVAREFKLAPNAVYQLKNRVLRAVRKELGRFGGGRRSLEDLAEALLAAEREGR